MKQLLLIILTLTFGLFVNDINAQKKHAKKHKVKHEKKTIVYKGKGSKKAVIHKEKRDKTTVVHKGKRHVHTHKRVKRTRVVHHHYRHLPKRGAIVSSIHTKSRIFKFGGIGFRFYSGVWYKPYGTKWIVVRPSYGIRINVLPVGHRKIIIGSNIYYYYYGTYYVKKNNEYEVIKAPIGAEVGSLPDGYNVINIEGNKYYELDGVYYLPSLNNKGEEVLIVIKKPTL